MRPLQFAGNSVLPTKLEVLCLGHEGVVSFISLLCSPVT